MHPRIALLPSLFCLIGLTMPAAGGSPRTDRYGDPLPDGAVFRIGTTRLRHEIMVVPPFHNVLISPDGKFVFSSDGQEPGVCMWQTATGRQVRRFHTEDPWTEICISADGSLLAIRGSGGTSLYSTAAGKKIRILPFSGSNANLLGFSPDGKILIAFHHEANSSKYSIHRWEAATGKNIENWELGANRPGALSADARFVASIEVKDDFPAAKNKQECIIRLWELSTHKKVREWKVSAEAPGDSRRLIFSPDGHYLVTAGEDAIVRVHETASGKEVRSWNGRTGNDACAEPNHAAVGWLAFTPDGKTLASVDCNCVLRFWDWKTGREQHRFDRVSGPISFSADGKILAAGGDDSRVRLWDTTTGRDLCPFADPGGIVRIDFSPDGRLLAAGSDRPLVQLVDPRNGRLLKQYPNCRLGSFSPDSGRLLVRNRDHLLALLDVATGEERIRFRGTEKAASLEGWDGEKKLLLTTGYSSVRIWETESGKMRREIRGHKKPSERFGDTHHCCPAGRTVAMTDKKAGLIRLFATDTGKELRQLTGYSAAVSYRFQLDRATYTASTDSFPIYSPDGKFLLAACDANSFALWDVAGGTRILHWNCAELLPICPTFSADGKWLALLDPHLTLCLVDTRTGRMRHRLNREKFDPEPEWVFDSLNRAFSADGRLLAVAYNPRRLVLWETATGRPIRTWPGHGRGPLFRMAFSPDSRRLATASRDGTALVWDVTGLSPDGQLPARKLKPSEAAQAWKELADTDATKAHRALWSLVADPERALPLLREHLHPMPAIDARHLAQLIADLDSNEFTLRETATRELKKMGESAQPALRAALKNKSSLEMRRRMQALLEEIDGEALSAESLRGVRAVAVLEQIANAEAQKRLAVLAAGADGARLTQEAKASLPRLRSRYASEGNPR